MLKKKTMIHSRKVLNVGTLQATNEALKALVLEKYRDFNSAPNELYSVITYAGMCILEIEGINDLSETKADRLDSCNDLKIQALNLINAINEILNAELNDCPFKATDWYREKVEDWLRQLLADGLASIDYASTAAAEIINSGSIGAARPAQPE